MHAIHIVHPAYKDGPPTFTPMRSELRRIHAPVFDLFAAMLRGEDLKGYRRVIEPEPVWETAREIRTKLLERYEGAEYVGRIIEVENRLISPLWLKTERCEGEDVFAVLLTDTWLAASNPVPNDDMSRELPRQTRAYVVSVTPYWYEIRTAQEFRAGPIGRFGPIGIGPYEDTATGPMVTEKERLGAVSAPSGPQWDR
ncbi:MAG: type-F conjugative transfer system secretin TraK [Nitrospirae bacterium]|nr:type-F conjugative transfer system secretin TraK [Nitrospirota bacterium]